MIEIKNVTKVYNKDKVAVDNLSLSIEKGHIVGFIGANGAGKTTTLKMLCGILEPTNGKILINGKDIAEDPIEVKKDFGIVFDSPDQFLYLKGIEFLNFIADVYHVSASDRIERIEELSKEFGISDVLNDTIESYSHGMRQKIMVIGVLLHNPKIWLLDEPLTGLDPSAALHLKNRMRKHANQGNIVLFSTHVLEVAEKLCDEIAIIDGGKLMYSGSLTTLQEQYPNTTLEDLFFKVVAPQNGE